MLVRERLYEVALERGLRQSTLLSYERLLRQIGVLDQEVCSVALEGVMEALWGLSSPNTRRSAIVALRAVLGLQIRIPHSVPRRYDLPDEDSLRLALMTSPHEVRGLSMMYAGLRIGEACAITKRDVRGDRLSVDKQVIQLHRTGYPTTNRIGPVKSVEGSVVIPVWLSERLGTLDGTTRPDVVRESLRRAGRKVGISLNPHMLRHWYATTMLARGVPLSLVSKQMRHSDIATTLRSYSQSNEQTIHEVFE